MWTCKRVEQVFLNYFESNGHFLAPESSLIPDNDDSILFVNSGMVQFKKIFLGLENPKHKRVCNSQKCIRAGGKHNDLDDVGKDSYHHTLFNMLGNWSFQYRDGENESYYKEKSIEMAWDLLTTVYKLDKNQLYVTYFHGNENLNLLPDFESQNIWKKYLPENRILPFGMKDNFWEMGNVGPCGPCTEIHYDRIGGRDASELVNKDDPNVIEIWNIVFMQYNRVNDESFLILKEKHVDTGCGLERLTSILQNCTNYQIDIYQNVIKIIQETLNGPEYKDLYGNDDSDFTNTYYRILADHCRTIIYSIIDGVRPGSNSRNYVLRRLIRRSIGCGRKFNAPDGFLSLIINKLIPIMKDSHINNESEKICSVVLEEEFKFEKVMKKGIKYFYKLLTQSVNMVDLFRLYTTFGFPIDVIKQLCQENEIEFDDGEYTRLFEAHIKISKK